MNSNYTALITILLFTSIQQVFGQNIEFHPQTDTVNAIDGCTGAQLICSLSSYNTTDSIVIAPGFNTYFEYLNDQGNWLPIDKVYSLIEDSSNNYQYELLYWPLGPLPYFTQIPFDSAFTAWDGYFKIIVVVDSLGTVVDSASQVFKAEFGLGIEEDFENIPAQITLYPNYPNPFNNSNTIRYYLPVRSNIKLSIFNSLGQLIEVLLNEEQFVGHHALKWYSKDALTGVYYIQLQTKHHSIINKCVLLK